MDEENLAPSGFDPPTVQPVARRYTEYHTAFHNQGHFTGNIASENFYVVPCMLRERSLTSTHVTIDGHPDHGGRKWRMDLTSSGQGKTAETCEHCKEPSRNEMTWDT